MAKSLRIVGFDCGEDDHRAVLLDASGEIESRYVVVNERRRVEELLAELLLVLGSEEELAVVVESKRSHGRVVSDVAVELGCDLRQVNTVALNHFRDLEGQPRKDDEWLSTREIKNSPGGNRRGIMPAVESIVADYDFESLGIQTISYNGQSFRVQQMQSGPVQPVCIYRADIPKLDRVACVIHKKDLTPGSDDLKRTGRSRNGREE